MSDAVSETQVEKVLRLRREYEAAKREYNQKITDTVEAWLDAENSLSTGEYDVYIAKWREDRG